MVWVIDASAIINCKNVVPARAQWDLFERLKVMVANGELCFPRKVTQELHVARHVDTPEAWTLNVADLVQRAHDPNSEFLAEVMRIAGDLVEVDAENDPADPYVLAQALEIRSGGEDVCVVTDDIDNHLPVKISMKTACGRFTPRIENWCANEYLPAISFI